MSDLSENRIRSVITGRDTGPFGQVISYFEQIDSTNTYLRGLAERGAPEGTLAIADEQTAGRGRMGRRWDAAAGTSLLFSLIFRPTLPPEQASRLVMACGLGIAGACDSRLPEPVQVKWPNDLLITGRKFTGILPESGITAGRLGWVVVGMGVNVNLQIDPASPYAPISISLLMATGRVYDRAELLADILERIAAWYRQVERPALLDAWRARCSTLGQRVRLREATGEIEGIAEDIDPGGGLWLREDGGTHRLLSAGEVTVIKDA
ncbi:MAG: biotin--[acetyl-CoA-carboxylase] ligase [Anaerolineae bacterium]|mgnify:CR=1 FL=1|nr:biotin--[acetyl-CoA-carboxylase] ligase [Anaerolineae bacterium]